MVHETVNENKYLMISPIVINNYLLLGNRGKKIDVINCDNREFIEPIKIEHDYIMISFLKLNDNTFIGADGAGNIHVFNIGKEKIELKYTFRTNDYHSSLLEKYKDNIIIVGSADGIKLWEIE